jgi:hypothetical protein
MQVNIGKGISLDCEPTQLPDNVLQHVFYIGLRNILMDSHASVTPKSIVPENGHDLSDGEVASLVVERSREVAEKKWAAMLAGEVRAAGERAPRVTDPVEELANDMARREVVRAIRAAGRKAKEFDTAWFTKAIAAFRAEKPSFEREARKIVAERAKNAKVFNLDNLDFETETET